LFTFRTAGHARLERERIRIDLTLEISMDRRSFLRSTAIAAGVASLGPAFWQSAYAATATPGIGPYGGLLPADANGVMLPKGFTSKILATSGSIVPGTTYPWHPAPDGGAVFPQSDGGWVYTSNSEIPFGGGAGALRFNAKGEIAGAYRILTGTSLNCAGGPTPWGTWLSGEENPLGQVYECAVGAAGQGKALPALGTFAHEAVTVDAKRKQLYLTEDTTDGRFYRFTPKAYPMLTEGLLEVLFADAAGNVTWKPALAPTMPQSRNRLAGSMVFAGGEGVWFDADHVYFTTKGDNRVWDLDVAAQKLSILYDAKVLGDKAPLTGVDNVVVSQSGDIFIGEDGGNLEVIIISTERQVAPVARLIGHDASEITGPAFSPDGKRLYFSSQRGKDSRGVTFEVSGPFRTARVAAPARGTLTPTGKKAAPQQAPKPAGGSLPTTGLGAAPVVAGAAVAAGLAGAAYARRTSGQPES